MRITHQGRQAVLTIEALNQSILSSIKNIPGKKKWIGTSVHFEPTAAALSYVRAAFPQAEWEAESKKFLETLELIHKSAITAPQVVMRDYLYKTKPFDHQDKVFKLSRDLNIFALFMEQGTGKSKVICDNAAYLWSKGLIRGLLVIAYPNGVHENWVRTEAPAHIPEWCNWISVAWSSQKGEKALDKIYQMSFEDTQLRMLTINVEALSTKRGVEVCRKFLTSYPSMMVVDESSSIKKMSAKRTKSIIKLGAYAPYRRILTGTPGGPLHLYSQFLFLDEDVLGFGSFYTFRNRYAVLRALPNKTDRRGHKIEVVVGYQHTEELQQKIKPWSFRVMKKDCLDLPPKLYLPTLKVKLTDEQRKIYVQFVEEMMAEFKGRVITAELAITRMLRCHQVVCGFMPPAHPEDFGEALEGGNPRLGVLTDYLETIVPFDSETKSFTEDTKAIIWANYRYNIKEIVEELTRIYGPGTVLPFSGKTPKNLRPQIVEEFQKPDSKVKFLVANKAAAYGWTLTAARFCVYYSNNFDLEVRLQSEDRPHRIGQLNPVTYVDLEAEKTIDSTIIKRLRKNYQLSATIMGDEISQWMAGEFTTDDKATL